MFILSITLGSLGDSKAYLLIHAMVLQEHVKVSHSLEHFDAPQNTSASICIILLSCWDHNGSEEL